MSDNHHRKLDRGSSPPFQNPQYDPEKKSGDPGINKKNPVDPSREEWGKKSTGKNPTSHLHVDHTDVWYDFGGEGG